jgi:hypothetical protein
MVPENKQAEDTNKLTLLAFKIIVILHNTLLATFIKLLETVSKGLFRNRSQNRLHTFLDCRHVAAIQERVSEVQFTQLFGHTMYIHCYTYIDSVFLK